MTLDLNILDMVLEFVDDTVPVQHKPPRPLPFNKTENEIIDLELATLIQKGVVEPAEHLLESSFQTFSLGKSVISLFKQF